MEDMILNGLQESEPKKPVKKEEKYNPVNDLKFFNDSDFMILWKEFMSIRIRKKASNTDRAIKTIINKIVKISKCNKKYALAMLEKSVNSGWSDVYEVKDYVIPISEKKVTNTDKYNYREEKEQITEEEKKVNLSEFRTQLKSKIKRV